ncbi:unnamed protein product [Allacma fusca]|uniref:Nuclear pore complex protein Nup153 n=1 Tax=Allacma fusca TaxID=39272 RepID=A0A8J2Q5V1_9HEXA|nr:unnamed protein product [Allacma fusca]
MIKSPVGKVQPSPERLAVQMKYMERRYDDVLGKVLEQNALILNSVARMQDDLKTLRTKLESLELSVQEDAVQKVNGVDSRLSENGLPGQVGPQTPASALVGQAISSLPTPFQPPGPFYNPYASPLYNPYMMMPDPMSYFVNPSMQYAAMYGALSQNAAAAVATVAEPPKPAIPPFSFGVQLPTSVSDSANTSSSSVNMSFSSPKPPVAEVTKKVENGIPTATFVPPKQLPVAETPKDVVGTISFTPPKQLPVTTTTAVKAETKPPPAQVTPPKPISVIGTSTPVKTGSGVAVSSVNSAPSPVINLSTSGGTSGFPSSGTTTFGFPAKNQAVTTASIFSTPTSAPASTIAGLNKPFTFGLTSTSQVDGPLLSTPLNPPKTTTASAPAVSKMEADKGTDIAKEAKPLAPTIDFAALSSKMCSFEDIKSKATTDVNPFGSFKGFGTVSGVQPVFGSVTPSTAAKPKAFTDSSSPAITSKSGHDETHEEDDFIPTAEFKPVIPLPPLVDVKKGDEDEIVLFQHRAKLLRFVKETKEWKERGVGDIKILQAKEKTQKIRVVMWREKVHKIACNHWVTKEINVTNYQGSPKNLMWTAIDFAEAEEGPKPEIFVCRFGQEEQAKEFKKQMEHAVSLVGQAPNTPEKLETKETSKSAPKTEDTKPAPLAPLSQMFKKPEGQWSCDVCYTDNKKESLACAACTTPKPGAQQVAKPVDVSPPKFTFGFGAPSFVAPVDVSKDTSVKIENKDKDVFTLKSTNAVSSSITFGFGTPVTKTPEPELKKEEPAPATPKPFIDFSKISSNMPSFGALASNNNSSTSIFGPNKGFGGVSVTPVFGAPLAKPSEPANSGSPGALKTEENEDEFVPTAVFEPVIPLPPLVEIKKGDEDETILFSNRAKLLRFVKETKEWKERGLGDIKILQSKDNESKIRVVMWREKVHKIACNHLVTKEMEVVNYQGMSKNLMWTAVDFAEGDPKTEIFVAKFGNDDKAQEFKAQMEKAINVVKNAPSTPEKSKEKVTQAADQSSQKPISELFKKPEGEWSCVACYCSNSKDRTSCVSCSTAKPNSDVSTSSLTTISSSVTSNEDGRKVPTFEDIPKPQRPQSNETLKDLLTKNTESNKASALSTFSFSLATTTAAALPTSTTFVSSDLKPTVPTFSFVPNFTFSADKSPIVGSGLISDDRDSTKQEPNVPTTIASFGDNNDDDNEDEGDEDDEEEEDTMFVSEGHAFYKTQDENGDYADYGEGQVKIVYDGDHFCARFLFVSSSDDDDLYVDHIIAAETQIKSTDENAFEWNCVCYNGDRASKGRVKVKFPDQQAFDSFASAMSDSVDIAMQAGVTEEDLANSGDQD